MSKRKVEKVVEDETEEIERRLKIAGNTIDKRREVRVIGYKDRYDFLFKVTDKTTGKVLDDNFGKGYRTVEEAYDAWSKKMLGPMPKYVYIKMKDGFVVQTSAKEFFESVRKKANDDWACGHMTDNPIKSREEFFQKIENVEDAVRKNPETVLELDEETMLYEVSEKEKQDEEK